jgi:alpha-ketoglutaric semialdehyde dehydrogenase
MNPLLHCIDGQFVPSVGTATRERRNPSDHDDVVAVAPIGSADDVAAAVAAAHAALPAWRAATGPARADALHRLGEAIGRRADALAAMIAREVGKPIGEAKGEVGRAVAICRYCAGEAVRESGSVIPSQFGDALQFTVRDPLGVVALITPWNFPLAIPLWKAAPALAFGNTVVLKPSELSPMVTQLLAEAAVEALPRGIFNVVHGDGTTGAHLVNGAPVRGVSFTGSMRAGAAVRAAASARGIAVQAEMGGKNALVVCEDADLERAARLAAAGAFRYAGQKCTATSRVIVHSAVRAPFVARLVAEMQALPLGPVTDASAAIGPLITAEARDRVAAFVAAHPGELLAEHAIPNGAPWDGGHWCAPRILGVPDAQHPLAQEELFAPIVALLEVPSLEAAIAAVNATPAGLSASIITRDLHAAMQWIRHVEVGLVRINGDTTGVDPHAPFGGMKASGSGGREQGPAARDFYTESRTIQLHA